MTNLRRWLLMMLLLLLLLLLFVVCCWLWFVSVDGLVCVFPCVTVFVVCCVSALLCVLCTVYFGCDTMDCDAIRSDGIRYGGSWIGAAGGDGDIVG